MAVTESTTPERPLWSIRQLRDLCDQAEARGDTHILVFFDRAGPVDT